jgi:UDP-N-acetyl-2-amino-2-deoxyglucuronate dehydrogenase
MKSFALIGAAGYVAPRHMHAIRDVGGDLKAAFDPKDSIGVIDRFFPDASFFVEFERFDRHIDKLRRVKDPIDYVSICSPSYLHDAHVRFALHLGANAICEKPLVLNPWNLDGLAEVAQHTNRNVNTIMQLRFHPIIQALRERIMVDSTIMHEIDVTYITSRGRWYQTSWKGDDAKSGGIATNIGIHLFDMLVYIFGAASRNIVHLRTTHRAAGYLELARAKVRWFLSIAREDLPSGLRNGQLTWRSIQIDGSELEFSDGFTDLHTTSYREILAGRGFGIEDVRPSVEITSGLHSAPIEWHKGERHPFVRKQMI